MRKKSLLLLLLMAMFAPWAAQAQEELTVNDGTVTNARIPVNGLYTDTQGTTSEFIIPAETEGMSDMEGGTISKVTFYISEIPGTWGSPVIQLYLGEVEGTTLSSLYGPSNFTVVKTMVWSNQQSTIEVEFDEPYTYEGGNLLIGTYVQTSSSYKTTNFYGVNGETGCSMYNNGSGTGTSQNFLPKTTFTYTAGSGVICEKPETLVAEDITSDGATLTWTGGSGNYNVEYKLASDAEWTSFLANTTATTYNLTGLTPGSAYQARVQSVCDDATSAWKSVSFTTECDIIPALGYTENFDSYSGVTSGTTNNLPLCWNYINESTNSTYQGYPVVYANSTYSTYANSAPNCLRFYAYGTTCTDQYAILPEMNGLNGKQITLQAKGYNSGNAFKIGMMTDPTDATTFVEIATQTLTTSYQEFEFILGEGNHVAIMMEAPTGYTTVGVCIDDITIAEAPTCLKPTELAVTGVSTTTATLGWTNGSDDQTAWQICLNGDEENLIMANTNPFTIVDLTAATSYTAKVRAYCGEDDQSDWSNEVSFATLCEAITTFPWSEDFNSLTAGIPDCWDNSEGTTTTGTYKWNYYATGHDGAGLRFNSYNNSNGLTNFLKTVSLSLPSDQLMQLSFWYKNPTGGDFSVYISTDGGATHETALATGLTGVSTWTELTISLADYAGQEVVIVFKGTSNYGYGDAYIYLDDVTVMEVPTCLKPNGLEVTATTTTTATLSWTAGANETAWQICLNGDETNLIMAESNPFTVEDLTASTSYTAKVRAYCNADDQSDWSNEVSFATECEAIVVDAANPFTEGFDGDWTPLCWESIPYVSGTTTRRWTKTTTSSNIHTGAGAAYSGYYGPIYLVMPDLQLGTDGDAVQLTFWSYNSYVDDYDKNSVVLLDGENEIELWSPESVNSSWEETTIDLSAYMGQTISLAFKYEGDNAHGWYVDDVRVGAPGYTLTIDGVGEENWEGGKGGYYLIASPVNVDLTNHDMTTGEFDLYYFDQVGDEDGNEWMNYKNESFNLEPGKGYLYAHKIGGDFILSGTPYTGNGEVTLHKTTDAQFEGWNLVGNPYADEAYIERPYYRIDGAAVLDELETGAINAMEGVFVIAENDEETITFSTEQPGSKVSRLAINLSQGHNIMDRAIVRFDGGRQLPKFQLNENSTKVFIPQEGKDFAVVRSEAMGEMPVSFKAQSNGSYTFSFNAEEVSFAYLHLIDNMTGIETDLLANPSYNFEANTTDYANRFKLVFATGNNGDDDTFAFFSNGSFVINNEGNATVQVIDVNGRILNSETINGCANLNVKAAAGVYMIRLVNGDNVKVQKVVVK